MPLKMIATKNKKRDFVDFSAANSRFGEIAPFSQLFNQSPPNRGRVLSRQLCADLPLVVTPYNDRLMPKRREINLVCQIWCRFVVLRQF